MSLEIKNLSTQINFNFLRNDTFDLEIITILMGFAMAIFATIVLAAVSNGFTASLGKATVLYPALYGLSGSFVTIGLIFLAIHMCDGHRTLQTNRAQENQINYDDHL